MYCQSWSLWVKAERKLAKEGWIATTPNGHEQPSGWVQIRNKAMEQMHKFGSELGLSPAARTRIQVETQEKAPAVQKRKRRA
jgi:P27 family predicted phage terminase small subunit